MEHTWGGLPLLAIAACVAIVLGAFAVLRRLTVQWQRHRVATGSRLRELAAVALVAVTGVGLVLFAQDHFQRQEDASRLQAELMERDRVVKELRSRIDTEVNAVSEMLAERTLRNIERDTLTTARAELGRFAALKDPRIGQMQALIDNELEVRALLIQSQQQNDGPTLARVFARLSELVPQNEAYREKAAGLAKPGASGAP